MLLFVLSLIPLVVAITIPLSLPPKTPFISPTLFSFSIEQDRWLDWAGSGSPNSFATNAFDNLRQLTGHPPAIRIGANSEDHTNFNPALQYPQLIFPPPTQNVPYPEASSITVCDLFYQAAANLLPGTHVIWGVNFGQNNITAAVLETASIINAFDAPAVAQAGITLEFLEIGNEADLYSNNGARPRDSWNISEYITQWTTFATNVSAIFRNAKISSPKFIGASFAFSTATMSGFSPQAILAGGILDSQPGSLITTISQHHYSGSFCSGKRGLLADLMNKATIRSNLSYFGPDVDAAHQYSLDYILGETNSYSCHGAPGVSNTAGAAIWALDYALCASCLGVSRLYFHNGIGYKYNFIQPVPLKISILDGSPLPKPALPHVQPQYYAAIIAAEAIGSSDATQAIELPTEAPELAHIAAYAFFERGALVRALLINSAAFLSETATTRNRTTTHVDLSFSGSGTPPKGITIKRLAIEYADDTAGLTWGGQTYETADARVQGELQVSKASVDAGVDVQETEVVLLSFTY